MTSVLATVPAAVHAGATTSAGTGFPLLTAIIFLPAVAAAVVMFLPASRTRQLAKPIGAVAMVIEAALVATLMAEFKVEAGFQFISNHAWLGQFGIRWDIGVDGISLFLVGITALLFPIALLGPRQLGGEKSFVGWMLLLEAACMGTFLALDLFVFFVMFEITLVPGYFLISGFGGLRRNYAAMKFFIYTFAGSAFLFVAILSLVVLVAPYNGGHDTFSLITLARLAGRLPAADQKWIFVGFAIAFGVKIPLVPLHSWLPDAYSQAPTSGSMILAGILFKLGAYGLLRFGIFLLPAAATALAPALLTFAAIGILYGALVTIMQRDFKRLVAYASIADVAIIVLGFFAFSSQGVTGGVLEMVNHGLSTGAMFFLVGMVWERRRTTRIAELGGLAKGAPILAAITIAVIMSIIGLPGLNGFVGEFLVLLGTFITHRWWAVVGTSIVVTGAIYFLWAYQRVFQGPALGANAAVRDISMRELLAIAPLLAGILFVGIYPAPVLNRITPSVGHLLEHVEAASPSLRVPKSGRPTTVYAVPASQQVDVAPLVSHVSHGPGRVHTATATAATRHAATAATRHAATTHAGASR